MYKEKNGNDVLSLAILFYTEKNSLMFRTFAYHYPCFVSVAP